MLNKRLMLAALCSLILTACVTTNTTGTRNNVLVVDTSCEAFAPITFDCKPEDDGCAESGDTIETVNQVRAHNAAWEKLCGHKP